jgi:CheY-like chemotaxis protein
MEIAPEAAELDSPRTQALDILIVEDNRVNQKVLRQLLERLGHQFDVAEDGLAALEALEKHPYQVILMDLQMPRLDGLETTRRIRANGSAQPWIIAVTANAFEEDRLRCMAAGMNDYLSKPLRREALLRALNQVDSPVNC